MIYETANALVQDHQSLETATEKGEADNFVAALEFIAIVDYDYRSGAINRTDAYDT